MNGNTLKIVFATLIATLCFILVTMTALVVLSKITMDVYKDILSILGIPTLIGMISQAFFRADADHNGVPDYQETTTITTKKEEGKNEKIDPSS